MTLIAVLVCAETLQLEVHASDKRKAVIKQFNNDDLGLNDLKREINRVIVDEVQRIHVFHSEVHKQHLFKVTS